jgi:hypothetical protein
MLKEALALCGQYEGHRFRELHDAIRRYIVFESSVFANCQVCGNHVLMGVTHFCP